MPLKSITQVRFSMAADVLKQGDVTADPADPNDYGEWVNRQDPLTGEIVRVWEPYPDDDTTPNVDESVTFQKIPCLVRGIVDGGIRVAGTTERFGDSYQNMEYLKMWTPPSVVLSQRDRITNIRDRKNGRIFYIDEQYGTLAPKATVFNVNGITPLWDAFNNHKENFILLERAPD